MKTITTPVLRKFGFRSVMVTNGVIVAILIALCAVLSPQTPRILILTILFVNGLARSMQFTSLTTLTYVDIAKPQMSSATSFSSMIVQMAMGMGVAVGAIALRAAAVLKRQAPGIPTLGDFHIAFVLVAILAALAVIDCFTLAPDAGAVVSGHRPAGYTDNAPLKA